MTSSDCPTKSFLVCPEENEQKNLIFFCQKLYAIYSVPVINFWNLWNFPPYSKVRNKHTPTLINYLTFFKGLTDLIESILVVQGMNGATLILFAKIFQGLRLFKGVRLFQTLEYFPKVIDLNSQSWSVPKCFVCRIKRGSLIKFCNMACKKYLKFAMLLTKWKQRSGVL